MRINCSLCGKPVSSEMTESPVIAACVMCVECVTLQEVERRAALKEATIKGLTMYAWWKDGVQYVGTCGTTLKNAIKDLEEQCTL